MLYVDDIASGMETEADGYPPYKEAKTILKKIGFNLWKSHTNSTTLQEAIDITEALSSDCFNLWKFRTNSTALQEAIDITEALSSD